METFDPLRVAAALRSHGVDYVLVGGVATAAHGAPLDTDDIDILLPDDDENVSRVSLVLMELGAQPVDAGDEHRSSFSTVAGRLDLIELPVGYDEVSSRAVRTDLGRGVVAPVASMEDLARMKRDSGELIDAARLTTMADDEVRPAVGEDDAEPRSEHDEFSAPQHASGRIWRALERVDDFLNDLDSGKILKKRGAA
jgi:hypothetical protein